MTHFEHIGDVHVRLAATCSAPPVSISRILSLRIGDLLPCLLTPGASVSLVAEGTVVGKGELSLSGSHVVLHVTGLGSQQ